MIGSSGKKPEMGSRTTKCPGNTPVSSAEASKQGCLTLQDPAQLAQVGNKFREVPTSLQFSDLEKWIRSSLYMSWVLSRSLYSFWLRSSGLMPLALRNSWYATLNACPMDCAISWACSSSIGKRVVNGGTPGTPTLVNSLWHLRLLNNMSVSQSTSGYQSLPGTI